MNRQTKPTLLHYSSLALACSMALPAYASNIPDNVSQWVGGVSTKNPQSNATFAIGATADKGANFGSTFKLKQKLKISGDIRIAPEHIGKDGAIFIVVKYNDTWVMKSASGWKAWDFTLGGLIASSPIHPLLAVESPVVQDDMTAFSGDFEVFLGYKAEGDLNYNKTPFNFTVGLSEGTPDLGIQSFNASATEVQTSGNTRLRATVKNFGGAQAPNSQLFYYQRASNGNKENKLNTGDTQACTQTLFQLPAEHSIEKYCQIDVPSVEGDYFYGVCVKEAVGESNLKNNCSEAIKVTVKKAAEITTPTLIAQTTLLTGLSDQTKVFGSGNFTLAAAGGSGGGALTYSSGDTGIATVDSSTGEVTLLAAGITTITATRAADNIYSAQTASYNLTINAATLTAQDPLTGLSPQTKKLGSDKFTLTAIGGAVTSTGEVTYESSAPSIATVDSNTGEVSLLGIIGETTITATKAADTSYLEKTASYVLTTVPGMNDTGITFLGSLGNACVTDGTFEDCAKGRDAKERDGNFYKVGEGVAGFDFTKLGANGDALANQNVAWNAAGTEAIGSTWSCVRDNVTGLVWEVKTDATKDLYYNWGGTSAIGKGAGTQHGTYNGDWDGLVAGANDANVGLCGFNANWRVPTKSELASITDKGVAYGSPAIDTAYFPNTVNSYYWTASPSSYEELFAWLIDFNDSGNDTKGSRSNEPKYRVRLVH